MSLSKLYDDIVAKTKVDRSSREIADISSAVEEMLERLVSGGIEIDYLSKSFKFLKVDLEPCGSMTEHTSLWKSARRQFRQNKFLEFDYLAVLHNEDNVVEIRGGGCQGCREIYRGDKILEAEGTLFEAFDFNVYFLNALYSRIHSRCSCCVDPDDTCAEDDIHDNRPCTECTVVRDTGYLQIAKIPGISLRDVKHSEHCSLVFYWTSRTDSFLAPNVDTLQPTEKIKRLVIRVDLLTAFKFPSNSDGEQSGIKRFIIAKLCPYCRKRLMVSYCMHELYAFSHVSEQHKQCSIIIKFLYGQFIYWTGVDVYINSYHAKVAFLTHCQTCTDERKDCNTCITEILQSLVEAYRSRSLRLPDFHPVENWWVTGYADENRTAFQIPILSLLHVLSQLKSLNENHQCNSQYRPSHVVSLIKRTCRMLCEQGGPRIVGVDGKSPKCMISNNLSHYENHQSNSQMPTV